MRKEQEENKSVSQQAFLEQNTANVNLERAMEQKYESEKAAKALADETKELEQQKQEVLKQRSETDARLAEVTAQEQQIQDETKAAQQALQAHEKAEQEASEALSKIRMEEAGFEQQAGFIRENIKRVDTELAKLQEELVQLEKSAENADANVSEKERQASLRRTVVRNEGTDGRTVRITVKILLGRPYLKAV